MTKNTTSVNISLMLIIRLQRVGKRNEPTFRVVLTDSKNGPKSGKFLEVLGSYDPRDKNITKIDSERVKEWISKGAQVSDTVHNILINQGTIEGKKINVLPKKSPVVDEEAEKSAGAPKGEEVVAAETDPSSVETTTAENPAADKTPEPLKVEEEPKPEEIKEG